MKRIFLLCIILFMVSGCANVKSLAVDDIIHNAINSNMNAKNVNRVGYRYYKPRGLSLRDSDNYNEVFTSLNYTYYMYVDLVSYNSKVLFNYEENPKAYYSKKITNGDKFGYIEINNYKNNQYLIEIMYNYAKIEVIVYERDIKSSVMYAVSILSSITYNDSVIKNYMKIDTENLPEEKFDIFEIVGRDDYLQFKDEEDVLEDNNDPDYIK